MFSRILTKRVSNSSSTSTGLGLACLSNSSTNSTSVSSVRPMSTDVSSIVDAVGIGRLNHVAIAVPDLESSMSLYRDVLGAQVSEPEEQPEHGVYTVFVDLNEGGTRIELIHPLGEKSPIKNFLEKNPAGGIHHICVEVNDVKEAIVNLKGRGMRVLMEDPKIGAHGNPVTFIHPKDCNGVLLELEEVKQ
eukprot:TRINITY_DN1452_c0_g1_i5.p3 TRINITY_DN1452_c0_g1~~TRINITY_DN1452_c0_g1_i5.p3  ORF type:complete len:190 (+),score=67.99 TRINITY_DN1452_c0_g1_i5:1527-2096(+)